MKGENNWPTKNSVRRATVDDLPVIATVHKSAYSKTHFTALLPAHVLVRYYRYFIDDGCEIHVVTSHSGVGESIDAFAVFGVNVPEKIASFKRDCWLDILLASMRHPLISTKKAISAVANKLVGNADYEYSDFLLLSIASIKKSGGIGTQLIDLLKNRAESIGFDRVGLFVNYDNDAAINLYFKNKFKIISRVNRQYYMELSIR